ncbi:MAG: branched-chain amino acid transaminase [Magnetovibrio sp.]|nr:branched-chain amino acid transaminase [Magnetovibrio sp.]
MTGKGPRDYEDLIVYMNGEYVPWADATVHVFSPAVKYGAGVFEGIRGYWSEARGEMLIFRLEDHLKRLEYSQKVMGFERIVTADELAEPILEMMRRNAFTEHVHIRPTVFVEGDGESSAKGPVGVSITAVRRPKKAFVETGCRAQVSSWQRIADTAMPTRVKANANYNNSRMAALQASKDGYDTAIILNSRGQVSEGPAMCFFMVRDGRPVTPSITSNILESITRATIIELLGNDLDAATVERDVDRSELYAAEEAFFCGTAWEVSPVVSIDGMPVGTGEVGALTRKLQSVYFDLVTGVTNDDRGWLTAV